MYCGFGEMTSSAFIRSIGMMRRMPVSGLVLRSPISLSSSCETVFTSAFCSVNTPADMPDIQSMSNMSIVSIRCRSSTLGAGEDQQVARLVGAHGLRVLRERLEDAQHLAHADVAAAARSAPSSRAAARAVELPSCGVTLPRTAAACGTIFQRLSSLTIVAPFIRSSVSSVAGSALARNAASIVRIVTWPPTFGSIV